MTDTRCEQARALGSKELSAPPVARSRKLSVLVVDDEPQVLRATHRMLCNQYKVETATSAEQAIIMMSKKRFHLVLTDYEMPGKNGLWLLRLAQKRYPTMRRGLISGSNPKMISVHILSGLVDFFVPKPASYDELVSLIAKPKATPALRKASG